MKLLSGLQTMMALATLTSQVVSGYTLMRCKHDDRSMAGDWDVTAEICSQLGGQLLRVCLRAAQEYCMVEATAADNQGVVIDYALAFKVKCRNQNSANIVSTC